MLFWLLEGRLGATVGSLGAVGARAVLTAVSKTQLTTKKNELQINLVAANLGSKEKTLLIELVLMVR